MKVRWFDLVIMIFDEITLSTLIDKLGHFDGLADIWCKFTRLKFLWKQYKNDGRIGPLSQSQCDELASVLEHISAAPEPSKIFQAMLDVVVEQAAQLAGNPQSPASVNSTMQDDDAFTTPNMTLEHVPFARCKDTRMDPYTRRKQRATTQAKQF